MHPRWDGHWSDPVRVSPRDAEGEVVPVGEDDDSVADPPDTPYLAVNTERVRNHLYRATERDDVDIEAEDVGHLGAALDTLEEGELRRFGTLARELEVQDREDLPFLALTDTEREYFTLLETALARLDQDRDRAGSADDH